MWSGQILPRERSVDRLVEHARCEPIQDAFVTRPEQPDLDLSRVHGRRAVERLRMSSKARPCRAHPDSALGPGFGSFMRGQATPKMEYR